MSVGASPRILSYGDGEAMLGFGPAEGPQLLILQPLFEEMNRTRALIVAIARGLAARGIGCRLPDLPGTGESTQALDTLGWLDWRDAVTAAAAGAAISGTLSFRGGALLDDAIDAPHWRLAPTSGRSLLSDLRRSALASGSDPATPRRLYPRARPFRPACNTGCRRRRPHANGSSRLGRPAGRSAGRGHPRLAPPRATTG